MKGHENAALPSGVFFGACGHAKATIRARIGQASGIGFQRLMPPSTDEVAGEQRLLRSRMRSGPLMCSGEQGKGSECRSFELQMGGERQVRAAASGLE